MSNHHWISGWVRKMLFALALSTTGIAFAGQESTIFTYDGQDFIRAQTTLAKEDGTSAVNTKLDRNSPAYKELVKNVPIPEKPPYLVRNAMPAMLR